MTNHPKTLWMKTTTVFSVMILWVDWVLLGESFAAHDLGWNCSHLGAQLGWDIQGGSFMCLAP